MLVSNEIKNSIIKIASKEFQQQISNINLELYKGSNYGHYSTSVAFELAKKIGKSPKDVAEILISKLEEEDLVTKFEKIESINGFINFYFTESYLIELLNKEIDYDTLGTGDYFSGQKVIVEYTDPNPFKLFHIGHFMTNALGESVFRLINSQKAEAINACYQGDVGIHVAKTIFGILRNIEEKKYSLDDFLSLNNLHTIEQLGEAYVLGSKLYNNDIEKTLIQELNNTIFKISQKIARQEKIEVVNNYKESDKFSTDLIEKIYDKGRKESLDYFEGIYKQLGTKFNDYFFESVTGEIGTRIVQNSPIFEKSDGATIWNGKNHGMNVEVLINQYGLPTYGAKEIGLNLLKKIKYNPDLSIIFTAREQEFYFRDLIEIFKQLDFTQETIHLPHGELKLKTGKMSSRTGEVITLDDMIKQIKEEVIIRFSSKKDQDFLEKISDKIAISSLKYLILKNSMGTDIIYEPEVILDLNGNTGPYILYTYARCKSILNNAPIFDFVSHEQAETNAIEKELLVKAAMFNDIVQKSAKEYSPSTLANYIYDFAKTYNHFYNECKILNAPSTSSKVFRIFITLVSSKVLEKGLYLLGIEALENL
jgi:arginyl-tRNA synthetase